MRTAIILSVDDSSDDLMLLRLACSAAKVSFELVCVESGEKAIAYLETARACADRDRFPLPDLILLDLKMPGKSGFDVLRWVRAQPDFNDLPVKILTSSVHSEDRALALSLGANQFLVKPVGYDGLKQLVRTLDELLMARGTPHLGKSQFGINDREGLIGPG
jgi:CheY-like chemotaxis protein